MSQLFGKFGFVHRRLWRDDGLYRAGLCFGPAPLLGLVLAVAAWGISLKVSELTYHQPAWATQHGRAGEKGADGEPIAILPDNPLPTTTADGGLTGYEAGWRVTSHPIQVSGTLDVTVKPDSLSAFSLDGPYIEMDRILAGGPKGPLFVGVGGGFLAIRTPGIYVVTLRMDRPAANTATCLTRLGLGSRAIVSAMHLSMTNDVSKTSDAARLDLRPGLYRIVWVFGCWHDQQMTGPGRMTVLIGRPGEETPQPARPGDIVRLERSGQR